MHTTAQENCLKFVEDYDIKDKSVLDVGSMDVNGSVNHLFNNYTGLDIEAGNNVDIVFDGGKFPFKDNEFKVIVSTSCLEHDPQFWVTVKEMMRVASEYIYINVPSKQNYHAYPVDCWRFMGDSMQALAELSDDWELVETYTDKRLPWCDCVGIFKKC